MWQGEVYVEEALFLYRGEAGDNALHAHATLQLNVGLEGDISVKTEQAGLVTASAFYVKPGIKHALQPARQMLLILIEPQSVIARNLMNELGESSIGELMLPAIEEEIGKSELAEIADFLKKHFGREVEKLDPRLEMALEYLKVTALKGAVSRAASECGLSQARLRELAVTQLHIPLSKWLLWQSITRAFISLQNGSTFAEAAFDGGFSDQAHFNRSLKSLMGITPGTAKKSVE